MANAGALKKKTVSADTKWVMHADIENFKNTQIGSYILGELGKEGANKKLAAIQAIFNFDPRKDLIRRSHNKSKLGTYLHIAHSFFTRRMAERNSRSLRACNSIRLTPIATAE